MNTINKQVAHRNYIPYETVRELFDYDEDLGVLIRKSTGKIAGSITHNQVSRIRVQVKIKGIYYAASYLVWLHQTGEQVPPDLVIDHRNRNPLDNRLENLDICTIKANCNNKGRTRLSSEQCIAEAPYKYQFKDGRALSPSYLPETV